MDNSTLSGKSPLQGFSIASLMAEQLESGYPYGYTYPVGLHSQMDYYQGWGQNPAYTSGIKGMEGT